MDIWLRLLLDPRDLARSDSSLDRTRLGVGLLLDGEFLRYEHVAEESALPTLVGPPPRSARGEKGLLGALVAHVRGETDAADLYDQARGTSQRARARDCLVAVLASMNAADAGERDRAVALLESVTPPSSLWSAVIEIHRSVRLAEADRAEDALGAIASARLSLAASYSDAAYRAGLSWLAEMNYRHFSWLAEGKFFSEPVGAIRPRFIEDVDFRLQRGLEAYLNGNFKAAVRHLGSRSIQFQSEDPITSRLDSALMRSECLADWELSARVRSTVARWRLINSLGQPEGNPEIGFDLLRRARDGEVLEQAIAFGRIVGPLRSVRLFGTSILQQPWATIERDTCLRAVTQSAEMIASGVAALGIERLVDEWDQLRRGAFQRLFHHRVIEGIAALLLAAPGESHGRVAEFLHRLAESSSDALELQTLARALSAIDWTEVPEPSLRNWHAFSAEHLGNNSDKGIVASRAAAVLADVDPERWRPLILETYERTHQLDLAALLIDQDARLTPTVLAAIARDAATAVATIVEDAVAGRWGFGRLVNAPLLLAVLHVRVPSLGLWGQVSALLFEPMVSADDKVPVLRFFARYPERLTEAERSEIAERRSSLKARGGLFGESPDEAEGAVFQLLLALDLIPDTGAVAQLLSWSNSAEGGLRLEAARSIGLVPEGKMQPELYVILLGLTRDSSLEVRAQALFVLASRRWVDDEATNMLGDRRLQEVLMETDSRGPLAVLQGLSQRSAGGGPIPGQLTNLAARLAESHLSALVRRDAWALCQTVELDPG